MDRKPRSPAAAGPRPRRPLNHLRYLTLRLPADAKATLDALAAVTGRTRRQTIEEALDCYVRTLPADDQTLVRSVRDRVKAHGRRGDTT